MQWKLTHMVFLVIALAAVAAASYRIVTAPQHTQERRATARSVCTSASGEWVQIDGEEWCRQPQASQAASR